MCGLKPSVNTEPHLFSGATRIFLMKHRNPFVKHFRRIHFQTDRRSGSQRQVE